MNEAKGTIVLRSAMLYLLLIALGCLFVFPFIWLLSTALKSSVENVFSFPPSFIPRSPSMHSFVEAWTSIPFPKYLMNSVLLLIFMVPAHLLLTAMAAYPLARMTFFGRNFIFYAIIGTMFLPEEGKLIPLFLTVQKLHMVDTWWGIIIPGLVGGFSTFLMRQAFLVIPKEMEEVALIDGCGLLMTWWKVIVPLTRPTLAAISVFSFISVWNSFLWPLVILKSDDLFPLALGLAYLMGTFGNEVRTMAAGTFISLIPVIAFYFVMQRHFVEGMQGAVKG